tara:strand:- start:6916 stop:7953 length:1038 start_codon:yes stop_codon:yes gene_type:complete
MPYESLHSSFFYFRFGLFSLAVWYVIDHSPKFIKYFSIFLLITFIVSIIDGYYQYFGDQYYNLFNFKSPSVRMSLLLNDKMILGGYLAKLFPLLLATLLVSFDLSRRNFLFICLLLIIIDILIFISGERTAFLSLFLSTFYIVLLISKFKFIRFFTFALSILVIAGITISDETIKKRNIDETISQITTQNDEGKNNFIIISEQHQSHYIGALKMFESNYIFGIGPNLFKFKCDDLEFKYDNHTCSTHPHNTYIQLLAETGLIGFLFIFCLFILFLYFSFKHLIHLLINSKKIIFSDYQIALMACLLITLWPLSPSQDFFNNWINVIYYLPIGFILSSFNLNKMNL